MVSNRYFAAALVRVPQFLDGCDYGSAHRARDSTDASRVSSGFYFESSKLSFSKHKLYYTVLGSFLIAGIVCTFAVSQGKHCCSMMCWWFHSSQSSTSYIIGNAFYQSPY